MSIWKRRDMSVDDRLREFVQGFGWRDVLLILARIARGQGRDNESQALANVLDHMARYQGHTVVRHASGGYEVELRAPDLQREVDWYRQHFATVLSAMHVAKDFPSMVAHVDAIVRAALQGSPA